VKNHRVCAFPANAFPPYVAIFVLCPLLSAFAAQPNVLWFVVDDMSPSFACYGETLIQTPAVDKLAAEGTKFTRAYVTAPVCSTCRSALITGMYQTTIGAHHHRSGRGEMKIHLPPEVTPVPVQFQKAGYYTCIGSGLPGLDIAACRFAVARARRRRAAARASARRTTISSGTRRCMTVTTGRSMAQKPFFMQVQLHGGKLREGSPEARAAFKQRVIAELGSATDPAKVTLPPYYPRDPVILDDWALYLDAARMTNLHVGRVMERLEKEGLLENTFVIFMTDHGISHARGKQFLYDEGAHIPFIVRGPGIAKGAVRDDLIMQIDMAAMSLAAAGIPIPKSMQGRDILAKDYQPRDAIFAARDRCDETVEYLRSVRTDRFLYIRNFLPQRPHLQPNAYKDGKAIVQRCVRCMRKGNCLPSPKTCSSAPRVRRRNSTTTTPIPSRSQPRRQSRLQSRTRSSPHSARSMDRRIGRQRP
jgi:hypothetical protein